MFKEDDIRPLNLAEKQIEYRQKDIDFLISHKDEFEHVCCPGCGKDNKDVKCSKNGFTYMECPSCSMMYTSPRPNDTLLKTFYANAENYKFFNEYIFPASKEVRRNKIFIPRVESIIRICEDNGVSRDSILEVGPGYGLFLEEMVKKNFFQRVVGVEASETLWQTSKEKGFCVYNNSFEQVRFDEQFNAIVAFEVLEHIYDPKMFLNKCFESIETGGLLMMTFPNYNGFDISVLGTVSDSVSHTHINYFNEKSIQMLLHDVGFSEVMTSTPGVMDTDLVRNKILSNQFNPTPFVREICIDRYDELGEKFQEFLISNGLSSNMMVVAIK